MFRKMSAVCLALFCAAALMLGCTAVVFASEAGDADSMAQYLKTQAGQLVNSIIQMDDAAIDQAIENYPDDPSIGAVQSWKDAKAEVGALKEVKEAEVKEDDDSYILKVPAEFETYDGEFELVIDKKTGSLNSATFNVNYPLSENMKRAGLNTLMGLGTVFVVLAFLMFVISLFQYIPNGTTKKTAPALAPAAAPIPAAPPAEEEEADDAELVAVLAAAIAAFEGTSPDGFVVRSIRKTARR